MFVAKIANYPGSGSEMQHNPDGSSCLCLTRLKLGGYNVLLEQDQSVIANNVKLKDTVHTSVIKVAGVKSYSEGETVVRDICSLLSLASMSQVRPYQFEFEGNIKRYSGIGEAMRFRPLIEIHDGSAIKSYLERTWVKYRKVKRSRKLSEVIEMLTTCELPGLPMEVKLGQMFIILENIKSTYAKYKKIPFIAGRYRELSDPPKSNPKKEKPLSFKVLLERMLKSQGMSPKLKRICTLRNEIIHFGLSRKPYKSLEKNYDYCHDIVREYLLRLLEYRGEYLIYSKACRAIDRI